MLSKHTFLSLILFIACALTGTLWAKENKGQDSWPQFHGPNRDNVSTETGLLKKWPDGGPALLWKAKGLGHGFSTVSIADGRIFTAGNIEGKTVVTALDMKGEILWQTENGPAWLKPHPGTRGTPTIDGERVYHESPHGQVVCLKADSGEMIWTRNILDDFNAKNITWGLAESLLVDGDRLIVCPCGPETAVVALDKTTGKTIWKSKPAKPLKPHKPSRPGRPALKYDLAGYASPILVERGGLRVILTFTAKALIGVNAETGDLLFRVPHESHANENVLTPLYRDGHVFISTIKGSSDMGGSVKWELVVKGDKASLKEIWRSNELHSHHDAVILIGDHLYGNSRAVNVELWVCLDWETGAKIYAEPGAGRGSLTYADGMLYTLSQEGAVALVRATPKGHAVISRFQLPAQIITKNPKKFDNPYWAHPVVCGGRLYLRHSDILYVHDIGE